jgi:anaerobic magnesium-protoporphyrin IX monomethyl ester cyclase
MEQLRRVTLVKPPMQVARANHLTLACPPIGLAYLAATLREQGTPVTIIDAVGEAPTHREPIAGSPQLLRYGLSDEALLARIPSDTDVLGFTCMFSEEWPLVRGVARRLRQHLPSAVIVAGGEHITAAPEFSMRDAGPGVIDLCVLGEGEETLAALVRALAQGRTGRDQPGLAYLDGDRFVRNPARPRIRALDRIPPPAWDLVPLDNYLSLGLGYGVNRGRSVPVIATRGCPFQCTFCSSPQMWTTRWAARDPELLLGEMEHAIERYGAQNFDFYDLTAIVRKDWIINFCRRLIDRRWGITWQIPAGTRSEAMDTEVVGLLAASGCRNVAYAPESGSPSVLKRIKKKIDLGRMKLSMQAAVRAGLQVKCNLIMGFPDETLAEACETIRFCHELAELGVHDVNVTPFCPYPGSELFEQLRASGRIAAMSDEYFHALASYSDLTRADSWSEHIPSWQLGVLRWAGMADFYGESFLRHPTRVLGLLRSLSTGKQETRLDKALSDIFRRSVPRAGAWGAQTPGP